MLTNNILASAIMVIMTYTEFHEPLVFIFPLQGIQRNLNWVILQLEEFLLFIKGTPNLENLAGPSPREKMGLC